MSHRHAPLLLLLAAFALTGCNAATPVQPAGPGTAATNFTLSGTVTGPGGVPLAGVKVSVGARVVQTDDLGRYAVTGLWGQVLAVAEKAEYEKQTIYAAMFSDQVRDISMRQAIRIQAGDTATITMLTDDPGFDLPSGYSECPAPCKAIRVFAPVGSQLPVWILVRARDQSRRLQIFVEDGMRDYCCVAEQGLFYLVAGGTEAVFHVRFHDSAGANGDPRIDIATSLQSR